MKTYLSVFVLFFISSNTYGQSSPEVLKGKVSFITSQNVYVKFENTDGIRIGDTLFVYQETKLVPALVVNSLSSISCVGTPLIKNAFTLSVQLVAKKREVKKTKSKKDSNSIISVSPNETSINTTFYNLKAKTTRERFDGRLAVSSYTNISNSYTSNERLRYNLTLNAEHIGNSNLSAESYISFTHLLSFPGKSKDWNGLNNALKIYSLALKHDLSKTSTINFGRKIYNNMANLGGHAVVRTETEFEAPSGQFLPTLQQVSKPLRPGRQPVFCRPQIQHGREGRTAWHAKGLYQHRAQFPNRLRARFVARVGSDGHHPVFIVFFRQQGARSILPQNRQQLLHFLEQRNHRAGVIAQRIFTQRRGHGQVIGLQIEQAQECGFHFQGNA